MTEGSLVQRSCGTGRVELWLSRRTSCTAPVEHSEPLVCVVEQLTECTRVQRCQAKSVQVSAACKKLTAPDMTWIVTTSLSRLLSP
eukprot:6481247-Amphidinium_carterae.1